MTTATLNGVRALAPELARRSDEIERARRIPTDLVEDLVAAGCFRMLVPRRYGGDELALPECLGILEELSRADGATGWTVMIGCWTPVLFGFLPLATFESIYAAGPDVIGAAALAPKGTALAVDGGLRVSGQWPFASGCQHSAWVAVQCVVLDRGEPRLAPNGAPVMRVAVLPAEQVEILDTWHVAGLRGTGSHDVRLKDAFCPEERTATVFGGTSNVEGTIYSVPVISQLGLLVSAVAVGIAQGAVDEIVALAAGGKRPAFSPRRIAESPLFQDRLGEADARLRAARALLRAEAERAWETASAGRPFTLLDRARLRATGPAVAGMAAQVVDACYEAGGGTSPYDASPLQRRLRDIRTLTQHAAAGREFYTLAGALLAGEEIDAGRI